MVELLCCNDLFTMVTWFSNRFTKALMRNDSTLSPCALDHDVQENLVINPRFQSLVYTSLPKPTVKTTMTAKQTQEPAIYTYNVGKYSILKLYKEDLIKTNAEMVHSWENLNQKPANKASTALKNETGKIPAYSGGKEFLEVKSTEAGKLKRVKKIIHAYSPQTSMTTSELGIMFGRIIDNGFYQGGSLAITVITSSKAADFTMKKLDFLVDLTGFCEMLCKVLQEKKNEIDIGFDVHLVDLDPANVAKMKVILDKHFASEKSEIDEGAVGGNLEEKCVICHDVITNPKILSCSHKFCKPCIDASFEYKPVCPSCGKIYGAVIGNMPPGTMKVDMMSFSLPGYSYDSKTYLITYNIPSGYQTEDHPSPGEWFDGTRWTAYLPDTPEGETVLRLLKVAFDRQLTFTVGRSRSTGRENAVTWNDIHHKTTSSSGGNFGYPDKGYFERVQGELADKGVTEADIDWSKSLKSIFNL